MGTDAFGRSTDEQGTRPTARTARPARPEGGGFGVPGWVAGLLIGVVGLGGSALYLVQEERANRDDPVQQAQRGEIQNLDPRSLLRADRLTAAYAAGTAGLPAGEIVTGLTVSSTGLELVTRDRGAFQRSVIVDVALGTTSRRQGRSEAAGVAPARLDVRGVQPAVERVLDRIEEDTARVDRVLVSFTEEDGVARQSEWRLQVDDVRPRDTTWYASVDGRTVRRSDEDASITRPELRPPETPAPAATPTRPSAPSSSSSTTTSTITIVRNGRRVKLSGAKARRLQRCLGAAAGDRPAFTKCLAEAGL
jgi:predicted nucleic acid-binding protein